MARKSRTGGQQLTQRTKVWRIGIYIRLSKEDSRHLDESESVSNQRKIIEEHVAEFQDGDEYVIVDEYVDDGISGTTDDERTSFLKLLADIERGRINCVIVKDLARSFRNYSDQGYYLDDWFPRHNVRFISLYHQTLDSYREPQNMRSIAVPIQGVLNENHCAETSDKVRAVFAMKRRNGEHIGSFAVYGYVKDPSNKNALIVDDEAAAVVRDIYQMFLDGMSKTAIVHHLNEHAVLCPSLYKHERLGLNYRNPMLDPAKKPLWSSVTVNNILKNRMYCGDMVQGRCRIKSYKIHIQEHVPEDEWFVVENTHEAIIPREVFDKVQRLLARDTRTAPQKQTVYLFSGFLRCADCGKAMTRSQIGTHVYYYCRTYKDQSKRACSKHTIRHDDLEAAVLCAIRQQVYLAVDYAKTIERLNHAPLAQSQSRKLLDAVDQKERELARIARYKQSIYQDWKDGELTAGEYRAMKADYERQAEEGGAVIAKLRAEIAELQNGVDAENPFLAAFRQHQNIDALTRDILIELVDQIKVYEGGRISIVFRFADEMRKVLNYIDASKQNEAV